MLRLVIELLTVVYLVWQLRLLYRRMIHGGEPPPPKKRPVPTAAPRRAAPPEDAVTLVRCDRCGVHVPHSRAWRRGDGAAFLCDGCSAGGAGAPSRG